MEVNARLSSKITLSLVSVLLVGMLGCDSAAPGGAVRILTG